MFTNSRIRRYVNARCREQLGVLIQRSAVRDDEFNFVPNHDHVVYQVPRAGSLQDGPANKFSVSMAVSRLWVLTRARYFHRALFALTPFGDVPTITTLINQGEPVKCSNDATLTALDHSERARSFSDERHEECCVRIILLRRRRSAVAHRSFTVWIKEKHPLVPPDHESIARDWFAIADSFQERVTAYRVLVSTDHRRRARSRRRGNPGGLTAPRIGSRTNVVRRSQFETAVTAPFAHLGHRRRRRRRGWDDGSAETARGRTSPRTRSGERLDARSGASVCGRCVIFTTVSSKHAHFLDVLSRQSAPRSFIDIHSS